MINYPYAAKIKVALRIGTGRAEHESVISPKTDHTEQEWNALSEQSRSHWVFSEAKKLVGKYITLECTVVKP